MKYVSSCLVVAALARGDSLGDPLSQLLQATAACPTRVAALASSLTAAGLTLRAALVSNRGAPGTAFGSFSVFEEATGEATVGGRALGEVGPGELLFGHFTRPTGAALDLADVPHRGALLVEAIAWDRAAAVFRFYEPIGTGTTAQWHYRGDSRDVREDVRLLHRPRPAGAAAFGSRLRCSGCHLSGGPILEEATAPHNDWWTDARPLSFAGRAPTPALSARLLGLSDASTFARGVDAALSAYVHHPRTQAWERYRCLQERLRPWFCSEEVQLASAAEPWSIPPSQAPGSSAQGMFHVPSAAFVDERLARKDLAVSAAALASALGQLGSRIPGTPHADGDHPWLSPVKARSDGARIDALTESGIIDDELATDVLAVDFQNPAHSPERCSLLASVPDEPAREDSTYWRVALERTIEARGDRAALALLRHLRDP